MSKTHRWKSIPGRRIAGNVPKLLGLTEKLHQALCALQKHLCNLETQVIFEFEKGQPVVIVVGPDGVLGKQDFIGVLNETCENEDFPELDIWAKAFEDAAKKLKINACKLRNKPKV